MPPANRHDPKRAKSSTSDYSVTEFLREFPDDAACLEHLWRSRYSPDGDHAHCPRCDCRRVFKRYATKQGRQSWTCTGCGHHVHPTAGTIFAKSSTSLRLWFHAMYLMTSTRCGISAKQLERELGVHYKTAWRMFNKIRNELMKDDALPLKGKVEVDETGVHGRPRGPKMTKKEAAQWRERQVSVLGMVERDGNVRAGVIPTDSLAYLEGSVTYNVKPGTRISTDDHRSYRHLGKVGFDHSVINHSEGEYARGDVHTNTIEGYWSRLKNSIKGTHVHVSEQHLWKYVSEFSYRYNMRKQPQEMFNRMILAVSLPRLEAD